MSLVADATSLPVVDKWSDLPGAGPYDGYRVIVSSLGRIALWNGTAWSNATLVNSVGSAASANVAANQANSAATMVSEIVSDFNDLLAKLIAAGLMAAP